jgi:hypothetical protein
MHERVPACSSRSHFQQRGQVHPQRVTTNKLQPGTRRRYSTSSAAMLQPRASQWIPHGGKSAFQRPKNAK